MRAARASRAHAAAWRAGARAPARIAVLHARLSGRRPPAGHGTAPARAFRAPLRPARTARGARKQRHRRHRHPLPFLLAERPLAGAQMARAHRPRSARPRRRERDRQAARRGSPPRRVCSARSHPAARPQRRGAVHPPRRGHAGRRFRQGGVLRRHRAGDRDPSGPRHAGRLEDRARHQRIPTRSEAITSAPTIASSTRSVCRFLASVMPCRTPAAPAAPAGRGARRRARGGPRPATAPGPATRRGRRTRRRAGTRPRSRAAPRAR